jgi:hypothetical protein
MSSSSLPPIDKSKRDLHHGNQNELQAVGLQKFHDFFKSKATSIPFDSSSMEMPGKIGKSVDIRVGPNFDLYPLLDAALPLEKPKLGKFDLEIWQKALDFGKQKYDTFELSEKEKGVVALVIRQKRQAELQAKQQQAELQAKQQLVGLTAAPAAAATAAQQQPSKQLTKEEEEAEKKRLKREKKARKAEKRERKRVKRENPNMEGGGGGENTKTGDTTTSMGTKTTAGPTAGTYSTGGTKS